MKALISKAVHDAAGMAGLALALRGFFRDRVTVAVARAEIQAALQRRGENFLEIARDRIYGCPESPYLRLLKLAGCEFSDLHTGIRRDGLDATLANLARAGVYLTAEEFRGKKPVIRGREVFRVSPADFRRPNPGGGFIAQSSGSSALPTRSFVPLDWVALRSRPVSLFFAAHDLFSAAYAFYDAMLPGSGGVQSLLAYAKAGIPVDRWFAREVPVQGRLQRLHHLSLTYLMVGSARVFGSPIPRPELVDPTDLSVIVRWALEQRARGRTCCIDTVASSAVRIAVAAGAMKASLDGVKFIVHGEPFTESKREAIERSGAAFTLRYSFSPAFFVGSGCARPSATDDVHVNHHLLAVLQRGAAFGQAPADALYFTTLHPLTPQLLLNVQNGDNATLASRDCGCALEEAGLRLHLSHIRSYEKFTGEGTNYYYGNLYEFVEQTLPAEFGGSIGDYQIAEEEDEAGQTRLTLRVDPKLGTIDEFKLLARLRAELGRGSWGNEFQARVWEKAGTLRVSRQAPVASARGKILPLEVQKKGPS